ncbi:MAG: GAF domain-containing protein [bacterium]|nr:GAF domain-containing protein [bacterium]
MKERKRIGILIFIMLIAALIVGGVSIGILYGTAINEQKERLVDTVKFQARLIEAVAQFNAEFTHKDLKKDSQAATIKQILEAHKNYELTRRTMEIMLAFRQHNVINFLHRHRYGSSSVTPTKLAEPMRLALEGKSGIITGVDYKGATVLAAYEPVPELSIGIVAKVDLAEVRRPFVRAGILILICAFLIILAGAVVFRKLSDPLVSNLEEQAHELEKKNISLLAEIKERKQAENDLGRSRDELVLYRNHLEDLVKDRTAELERESKERQRLEEIKDELYLNLVALWGLARLQDESLMTLSDYILKEICRITGSNYGFYGFLNEDETVMQLYSWSEEALADCAVKDKVIEYPIEKAGIWGDAVRKRKIILINDYNEDFEGKKGIPEGHVALTRVLAVPVFDRGKIAAIGVVANKDLEYTEDDINQLKTFLNNAFIITGRKKIEEEMKASLLEKEILLKEVHHRVKNNLQVISSMLNLQSRYISDTSVLNMLKEAGSRIQSMALIHKKLYESEKLSDIHFGEYAQGVIKELLRSYGAIGEITVDIKAEDSMLGINSAIPCALIMHELVTNSIKYAFPKSKNNRITISFCTLETGELELKICDNGVGLPEEINPEEKKTLGLSIVAILTEQLDGRLEVDRKNGTAVTITFKE